MAIQSYEENGKTYWRLYVHVRSSSDRSMREQKLVKGIASEKEAYRLQKKWTQILTERLAYREGRGLNWEQVLGRWELAMRAGQGYYAYDPSTILDYVRRLNKWTSVWFKRPANEINRADARELLRSIETAGLSRKTQKIIKDMVNVVFNWGIENRFIQNVHQSPMRGVPLTASKSEKVPDILTLEEIRTLLSRAKGINHPWYPIWAMALLTGMRNGELLALLWSDVDFENKRLTISKSYSCSRKTIKSTKSGHWRTVPISDELMVLLKELRLQSGDRNEVLPQVPGWRVGGQASKLREFCRQIGIRPIRFHALRACFATQLLAHDVAPATVMKICGWEQLDTMQRYIRMAGIEEKGATQCLKILPKDASMGTVINLFQ